VVVEPPDPFEGGEFDVLEAAPPGATLDELRFVEIFDRALGAQEIKARSTPSS
jgi:hypothetical protein